MLSVHQDSSSRLFSGDVRIWVIVPLILMIPLNVGFWFVYVDAQYSMSTELDPKIPTLWGYFESDTFKGITVSLVVPIFIFLIENRFKVLENYETNKYEKILQLKNNNREKRLEVIKNTEIMWSELFQLTSDIVYFDKSIDGKRRIKELLKKINNTSLKQSSSLHDLDIMFPNISDKDVYSLYSSASSLWQITFTVAYFIEDDIEMEDSDIRDLQICLRIIQEGYRVAYYRPTLDILKNSLKLLEIIEEYIPEHEVNTLTKDINKEIERLPLNVNNENNILPRKMADEIQNEILKKFEKFHEYKDSINQRMKMYWKPFPNVSENNETKEIKNYVNEFKKSVNILTSKSFKEYAGTEDWIQFKKSHDSIPFKLQLESYRYDYTRQGIKKLAEWFIFLYRYTQLTEAAKIK